MANIIDKIEATSLSDSDMFYGVVGGADRKVSAATLRGEIGTVAVSANIHLPDVMYTMVGNELNLYFGNFIQTSVPGGIAALEIDIRDQASAYTTPVGEQFGDHWAWTPSSASTEGLRIEVSQGGTLIASKDFSVEPVAASAGAANSRKVLLIGDSTSAIASGAGTACADLEMYGASEGPTITTVGAKSGSATDLDGTSRTVNNEADGGVQTSGYWLNTGAGSPFWNGGAFDFANYLSTNGITLSAGDWVIFHAGINDIFSGIGDTDIQNRVTKFVTAIDGMVAEMKADVSGLNYGLCLIMPQAGNPFAPREQQDAFGSLYDASQSAQDYRDARWQLLSQQLSEYNGREADDIYIMPTHAAIDPVTGFSSGSQSVHAYTNAMVTRYSDPIHPSAVGHHMAGAAMFGVIKGQE